MLWGDSMVTGIVVSKAPEAGGVSRGDIVCQCAVVCFPDGKPITNIIDDLVVYGSGVHIFQ